MKKQFTPRIQIERIGQRMEISIQANKTLATLLLMPIIFVLFTLVMVQFLQQAQAEAPWWWSIAFGSFIPFLGALFLRQWLWEYRGQETLRFDQLTQTFRYSQNGSFWLGEEKSWDLRTLDQIHVKKRGFLEGNLRLSLPPFCTLAGNSNGTSFQMGDSLSVEDGWRLWMEIRKEGFLKDEQFKENMLIPELDRQLNLK